MLITIQQVRVWSTVDMSLHQIIPLSAHLQGSTLSLSAMSMMTPVITFIVDQLKTLFGYLFVFLHSLNSSC